MQPAISKSDRLLVLLALAGAISTHGAPGNSIALLVVLSLAGIGLCASIWALGGRLMPRATPAAPPATRPAPPVGPGTCLPVFYASQTGTAEAYARQHARALADAGIPARAEALEDLTPERLASLTRALFIVSTTDDGDAPYPVAGFVRNVLEGHLPLPNLRYGLLALGDSYYDTYCGFGRRLDTWLEAQGAQALFPRVEVDDNDPMALEAWHEHLAALSDSPASPDWQEAPFTPWTLANRIELNPGSLGEPTFLLELRPTDAALPHWDGGDIAEIRPRHGAARLHDWLAASGLDGATQVPDGDGNTRLHERLARSELPEPGAQRDPVQVAETLVELRHRDYSIASLPSDGRIELLVRQGRRPDGTLSLGAAWLTREAAIGDSIDLRLRANPNFRAPQDASPLILIGNGTGLAGLRALLRERIRRGHLRNWLLFGERQRARDFYFGEELEEMLAANQLAHLDLAFSRDGTERRYVQHLLLEHAARLRTWVEDGATLCVCGSQEGMAAGVDASLRQILGGARVQALTEAGRYLRDVY